MASTSTSTSSSSTKLHKLSRPPPDEGQQQRRKKKLHKMNTNSVDLLSLFFAQYQTFEERFQLRPYNDDDDEVFIDDRAVVVELVVKSEPEKKDKGKEKMTEVEEEAARDEEESGEEGLLIDSLYDEDDSSLDPFSDDAFEDDADAFYNDLFDHDDYYDNNSSYDETDLPDLDHYVCRDFDMVETQADVALLNEGERWERDITSIKLGFVGRHSRANKKPRVRPGRWINVRDERRRCERAGLVFAQVSAYKANATRGLEYRTIDYQAIRQEIIVPSSSPSSSSSSSTSRTTTRAAPAHTHCHSSSSGDSGNGRIPSYEREVTRAIDRGSVVQCGLSAQQLNDLLNRELTPEDYELLLMLDTTVKPKTLSTNLIDSFPSRTVELGSALLSGDGERCAICMSAFEVGEDLKVLPSCQHSFHAECIVQWLSTASTKCPLCGCSLES